MNKVKDDRGRLLLSGSQSSVRMDRTVYLIAGIAGWAGIVPLLYVGSATGGEDFVGNVFMALLAVSLALCGVFLVVWSTKVQPLNLYEEGIENFHVFPWKWTFKPLSEIERAKVRIGSDWGVIIFRDADRSNRSRNRLVLEKRDIHKERLREIVEHLKSRNVEVGFGGRAKDFLFWGEER